jgi:glycosyltransferase involved in cell wall biosynthesis
MRTVIGTEAPLSKTASGSRAASGGARAPRRRGRTSAARARDLKPVPRVCTIFTRQELPQARVLARSLGQLHPKSRLTALCIDDPFTEREEKEVFDLIRVNELGITEEQFHVAAAHLSPPELATWLRPRLLVAMFDVAEGAPVLCLSPDSVVLSSLDRIVDALGGHAVGRVPLSTATDASTSARRHAEQPGELRAWVPGFLVATAPSREWLESVHARAVIGAHPQVIVGDALHADWDAPGVGEVDLAIIDRPGIGAGHWHLRDRVFSRWSDEYFVDNEPLVVFHFDGFDPTRPWALYPGSGASDDALLANDALEPLCRWYAEALTNDGFDAKAERSYRWATLPDGFVITRRIRQTVRDAIVGEVEGLKYELPPDPFNAETLPDFYRWMASVEPENELAPTTARFYYGIYRARDDLHAAFPELSLADAPAFRRWAADWAHHEYRIPPAVIEEAYENGAWPEVELPRWAPPDALREGFLVTGYLRAELGIADAARRTLVAMRKARLSSSGFSFSLTRSRQHDESLPDGEVATNLATNVIWVNADQLVYFSRFVGPEFFDGRYSVGCWAWETENPPEQMGGAARFLDEIWVPSSYSADAIRTITDVPVHVFGCPVEVPQVDASIDTRQLGMPDGFVFFFMFDFLSTISRKNPVGLVEAFCSAFGPGEGPTLVLKSINADERPVEAAGVRAAIGERPDVVFVDAYYSSAECAAMLARADCYVSLHRSEGFGLTLAESMALGVPVIATGYSGNLDFMDEEMTHLVPSGRSLVGRGSPPYPPDSVWGEPDLDAAAGLLRRVYEAPAEAAKRAGAARKKVLREHGYKEAERFLRGRAKDIKRRRRAGLGGTTGRLLREGQSIPDWVGLVHQVIDYPDP